MTRPLWCCYFVIGIFLCFWFQTFFHSHSPVALPMLKCTVCPISIIHLRCIREVFSDALSSLPISGYFCIISAPTVTPAWLWKSQAASVIATCYARASTKAKKKYNKAGLRSYYLPAQCITFDNAITNLPSNVKGKKHNTTSPWNLSHRYISFKNLVRLAR